MNALRSRTFVVLVAAAPLLFIFAAMNLDWSMFVAVPVMICTSFCISAYLVFVGRRVGIRWLVLWTVVFVILIPYANIVFVLAHLKRLTSLHVSSSIEGR